VNWKDKIEEKVSWIAIPRLLRHVSAAQFLVFILAKLVPGYLEYLALDPSAVLRGQLWRIVSWTFIPQTTSYLWILFSILWLWFLGDFLESSWGTLRTNVFFWLGVLGGVSAAFLTGNGGSMFNWYLNLSILFAFATLDPEYPVYFFFLPCKVKWLAWISIAILAYPFCLSSVLGKIAMILSFGNYLVFFVPAVLQEALYGRKIYKRRVRLFPHSHLEETLHYCYICGATEISAPDMDFRVSSSNGQEYCSKHLPSAPGTERNPPSQRDN
jgi:membrane associated rhomboid family serine protease